MQVKSKEYNENDAGCDFILNHCTSASKVIATSDADSEPKSKHKKPAIPMTDTDK